MKLLITANGYSHTPWTVNEPLEISVLKGQVFDPSDKEKKRKAIWSPWNKDFTAVGVASGGGVAAANIKELLNAIRKQSVESIEEMRILGHSNEDAFALGGDVKLDDVYFNNDAVLLGDSKDFEAAIPKFQELQDRFTRDAKIIMLGCHAGAGKKMLSQLSKAFLRTVGGFKEKINYNCEFNSAGTKILFRGRMHYGTSGSTANDLASVFGEQQVLGAYVTNAWDNNTLKPDMWNNDGDVYIGCRRKPGAGVTDVLWSILRQFYPNHPWISGSGYEATSPGLSVEKGDGGGWMLYAGDAFMKFTPRQLKDRIAEVGKAVELISKKTEGVVTSKQ